MVRKELLTVSLMADGYPIDGKPKDKAEKMHPEIWKRYALFALAILLAGIVAAAAIFAGQTPAKTTDPTEVKTPAENAVVNAATGAVAIPADVFKTTTGAMDWQKPFLISNAPKNILVEHQDILIKDLQIGPTQISGYWINTHPQEAQASVGGLLTIYFFKGNDLLDAVPMKVYDAASNEAYAVIERPIKTLNADRVNFMFG